MVRGVLAACVLGAVGLAGFSSQPAEGPAGAGRRGEGRGTDGVGRYGAVEGTSLEARLFQERVVNPRAIRASSELEDYEGLKCRVHLHVGFNPEAGMNRVSEGTSFSGLRLVNGVAVGAEGVLVEVDEEAIAVTGPNGHVWIPRDKVLAIEFIQNPPTERE